MNKTLFEITLTRTIEVKAFEESIAMDIAAAEIKEEIAARPIFDVFNFEAIETQGGRK